MTLFTYRDMQHYIENYFPSTVTFVATDKNVTEKVIVKDTVPVTRHQKCNDARKAIF